MIIDVFQRRPARGPVVLLAAAGLLIAGTTGPVVAADGAAPAATASETPAAKPIDPAAIEAFERMSAYVAGLPALAFETTYTFDVVARNGQTVTVRGTGRYLALRPDKLRVELDNDLFARTYVDDGASLVIASPQEHYFARVPIKGTIREVLAAAAAAHALEIPLADLFDLGTATTPVSRVESAFRVGTSRIGGVEAEHFAFRSEARDWEVWIRAGDQPVPLAFTLIDRTQETHPRTSVTLAWSERADIPESAFTFVPGPDDKPIGIRRIGQADDPAPAESTPAPVAPAAPAPASTAPAQAAPPPAAQPESKPSATPPAESKPAPSKPAGRK